MNIELKNTIVRVIEDEGLQGLAQAIKAAFEETAKQEEGISVSWQMNTFIGQLNKLF